MSSLCQNGKCRCVLPKKQCCKPHTCCKPESICVQTCHTKPLAVDASVTLEQPEEPLPIIGQIEVCNCCDQPLRTENDQLSTSRDINGIPAGTSIADLLAMLVTKEN